MCFLNTGMRAPARGGFRFGPWAQIDLPSKWALIERADLNWKFGSVEIFLKIYFYGDFQNIRRISRLETKLASNRHCKWR
jgi:hypothetical protein